MNPANAQPVEASLLGRDHPLRMLRAELDRTLASHGNLVLVAGEAGIGKTTLVGQVAAEAHQRGALVVSGTAWERGAPGYWPWVQVVRGLQRAAPAADWAAAREAAGSCLEYLLGEQPPAPSELDVRQLADEVTFHLHDAVTSLLVTASRGHPVVVVLDDLHWADAASVKLLEFVARHAWFERLLLVATYRDVEVDVDPAGHPLHHDIAPLLARAVTVTLTGLDTAAVRALITRTSGYEPDADLVAEVHRRTGGNPFYVEQAARLYGSGGRLDADTPGVREALRSRLANLPGTVVEILTAAAVIGPAFDRPLLAAASGVPEPGLTPLVEQAVAARLLRDLGGGQLGFVHDLVREALYASVAPAEVRKRHAAVVHALESGPDPESGPVRGTLAYHAYHAVPEIDPVTAQQYLLAAASDACARLAAGEVVDHLDRALALVPADAPAQRANIALDLAAMQRFAGELDRARKTFQDVVTLGRQLGDARLLARAVLGLHELGNNQDQAGQQAIQLADEAHAALLAHGVAPDDPLAVRTLAAASRARTHLAADAATAGESEELSSRAVELARRCGDSEALGLSLLARHDAIWRPGTAPERVALAGEMLATGDRNADLELALQGSLLRMVGLLEQGDPQAIGEHATFASRTEGVHLPTWHYQARTRQGMLATLTGRFPEARAAIDDAFTWGERTGEVNRWSMWREQHWLLSLLQGDFDEIERLVAAYQADGEPHGRLVRVVTAAHRGDAALTRPDAAEVLALAGTYRGMFAPVFLRAQAEVAAAVGDPQLCQDARAALVPVRDLWAVVAGGGLVHGPYAHWLALLDAAERRWADAVAGFTAARRAADRLGARPWSVEARLQLALTLRARDAAGDAQQAATLLDEVAQEATAIGMCHAAARARRAAAEAGLEPAGLEPAGLEPAGPEPAGPEPAPEFRFDGRVWTLRFAGRTVHLPDAKGLRDLHVLLGLPGTDVPASQLLHPEGGAVVRATGQLGADEVLDERAKAEYRRRLTELDEEIDRATELRQDRRAAELDQEREALLSELRSATGLGGRTRRLGDEGERARKTVTARIRDSLRRIATDHPELAEHLRASVSTGITCRYQPAREVSWTR